MHKQVDDVLAELLHRVGRVAAEEARELRVAGEPPRKSSETAATAS
jgi:hypothetical protein